MEQRRHDPYPWSWEAPAAAALLAGVVMVLGVHVGRGIACLVSGAGFRWVTADALLTSLGGIFSGDPGAGLTEPVTGVTGRVLATSIIVVEVVFVALLGVLGYWLLVRWGPGAMKGVASPSEAQQLLGRQRLVRARGHHPPRPVRHHHDRRTGVPANPRPTTRPPERRSATCPHCWAGRSARASSTHACSPNLGGEDAGHDALRPQGGGLADRHVPAPARR